MKAPLGILVAFGLAFGQTATVSHPTARIFVQKQANFDVFLSAALARKHVPVDLVADPKQADFEVGATLTGNASDLKMTDVKTGQLVFEWAGTGKSEKRLQKDAAEACADHINHTMVLRHYPRKSRLARALEQDPAFSF